MQNKLQRIIEIYIKTLEEYPVYPDCINKGSYGHFYAREIYLKRNYSVIERYLNNPLVMSKMLSIENGMNEPLNHATFIQFIDFLENRKVDSPKRPTNSTTNWTLLYLCNMSVSNYKKESEYKDCIDTLRKRIHNRIIWDSNTNCSQQYSLFSLFILSEIYQKCKFDRQELVPILDRHFQLVFSNNPNWFGRGRNQLFGDTIFICLGLRNIDLLSAENISLLTAVIDNFTKIYTKNGFIPFSRIDITTPFNDYFKDSRLGWYKYNSYIDYFFFSFYLLDYTISNASRDDYENSILINKHLDIIPEIISMKKNINIFRTLFEPKINADKLAIQSCPGSASNLTNSYDGTSLSIDDENIALPMRILRLIRFSIMNKRYLFIFSALPFKVKIICLKII